MPWPGQRHSVTNLETSTRQTFGSRNRSLYSPCGVHTQYRRPSRYEARAAHVIQPRTWLPCPGMNSRTCSTSPRAPQSRNFLACSEVIVAVNRRCHHGLTSPGTKQTYQAAASIVTGDPFSSSSSSVVSIGGASTNLQL